ncbi:MAG TPA: hypothetical protein ENN29_04060 [Candidatus Hydrogenedentes bacterium]|nr:hypothetical protein [Candidatus Hydrogenedentota bacterium]
MYYFFFVRPTYGVFHESLMENDTAVRVVLKPVLVQSYVSSLAPTGSKFIKGVPKVSSLQQFAFRTEWIHKMPFEFSFLLDQRSPEHFGVLFFVREHPTSESFADLVNDSGFFNALYPLRWEQQRVSRQSAAQLAARATLPIPETIRGEVSKAWPNYAPIDAPPVTGRHFIEVAVNNRNGALMELHGALARAVAPWADGNLERRMLQLWPVIEEARLVGNLAANNRLVFKGEVLCRNAVEAGDVRRLAENAGAAIGEYLRSTHGFHLTGGVEVSGSSAQAEYVLTGFEPQLRRALGG